MTTDAEREIAIQAAGRHMRACYDAGDRETARGWLAAMTAAIRERSVEQRRRMAEARGLPS